MIKSQQKEAFQVDHLFPELGHHSVISWKGNKLQSKNSVD